MKKLNNSESTATSEVVPVRNVWVSSTVISQTKNVSLQLPQIWWKCEWIFVKPENSVGWGREASLN